MTKGDKTKHQIFLAAMKLFDEKGYDRVSVSEIVREAGIAKGTFYIYYDTKAAVLAEIINEYDANYEALNEKIPPEASAREGLRLLFATSGRVTMEDIGWDKIRVFYSQQVAGVLDGSGSKDRSLYHIVTRQIRKGKANGEFKTSLTVEQLSEMLITWIRGAFFDWIVHHGDFDLAERCSMAVELFCDALD